MKTAIIAFKTQPAVKTKAQRVAQELGFGLSALLNGFLNHLIKSKTIEFSAYPKEEPTEYMLQTLKEARESASSPAFDNANNAIAYLHKEAKKYAN